MGSENDLPAGAVADIQTSWWKVNIDFERSSFAQLNKTGVDDKRFGGSESGSDPSPVV